MRTHLNRSGAARLVLAMVVAIGAAGAVVSEPSAQAPRAPGTPLRTGIGVHGSWTIEVKQPDGTLVERREFENALTNYGKSTLASILARNGTPDTWQILLEGQPSPCEVGSNNLGLCLMSEPSSLSVGLSEPINFEGFQTTVVLNGNMTAKRDGTIAAVATWLGCPSDQGGCHGYNEFTSHAIDIPIPVTNGQIVQVKVQISFS